MQLSTFNAHCEVCISPCAGFEPTKDRSYLLDSGLNFFFKRAAVRQSNSRCCRFFEPSPIHDDKYMGVIVHISWCITTVFCC